MFRKEEEKKLEIFNQWTSAVLIGYTARRWGSQKPIIFYSNPPPQIRLRSTPLIDVVQKTWHIQKRSSNSSHACRFTRESYEKFLYPERGVRPHTEGMIALVMQFRTCELHFKSLHHSPRNDST